LLVLQWQYLLQVSKGSIVFDGTDSSIELRKSLLGIEEFLLTH
jgi:hypothetical protein